MLFFIYKIGISQVGIGTNNPNTSAILDVNSSNKGFLPPRVTLTNATDASTILSPTTGLLVFNLGSDNLLAGYYYWNGANWATIATSTGSGNSFGDIKNGIQTTDHNGWILLNGRPKSTLTATQQTRATALGIGANLPDATNAFLVQNGSTLGGVTGTNAKTISQNNLPNVTLSGSTTTDGAHTHTISFSSTTPHNLSWGVTTNGIAGYNISTDETTSSSGAHYHTFTTSSLNGGVSQTTLDITPKSLSVNTFIFLGN